MQRPQWRRARVNHPEGFVKIIVGEKYGEILGAHIIGSDATELITEYGLGMKLEASKNLHNKLLNRYIPSRRL